MKGINHLVLASRDLDAQRSVFQALGFTVTPRGQHPFGTGNAIIQLHGSYIELLAVTIPKDVPEHQPRHFSFAAFNRDYLVRHEGFSMVVLDSPDAHADIAAWRAAGLQTYEPFEFSRIAHMPDGAEVRVGFSLAFVSHPAAPWLGLFACQHYRPEYYAQPHYQQHANAAMTVDDVWIVAPRPSDIAAYLGTVTGSEGVVKSIDRIEFQTRTGKMVLAVPQAFEAAFGVPAPHIEDGPILAGLTIGCRTLRAVSDRGLTKVGERYILPPEHGFGTAIGFVEVPSN